MGRYISRRLLLAIPTLWLTLTLIFIIFRLVPGDPAQLVAGEMAPQQIVDQIRQEMGLDKPLWYQYGQYLINTAKGDLGVSKVFGQKASAQLKLRIPKTALLAVTAMLLAVAVGLPAGVISAVRRNSIWDYSSMFGAIIGVCLPSFWLGLMLIILFSVELRLLPTAGASSWKHLILPSVTLAANQMAVIARMTRSSMLEVVSLDYVRTARAKGLSERVVILRHALRNALIPTLTVIGVQFGLLLGGSIIVETVFAWPGLGQLMIDSVRMRDYPLVQGVALVFAATFLAINLTVDVLYAYLDPRVRYD